MRTALCAALLLWQIPSSTPRAAPTAETKYLQYERAIEIPSSTAGQTCAVLDGTVFAHSSSRSTNDLRVFAERAGAPASEVPFVFTESPTLYTTVARTSVLYPSGDDTVAILRVPAHLPLERVALVLDPAFTQSFRRAITVTAAPIMRGGDSFAETEAVDGEIARTTSAPQPPGFDIALGANLRSTAEVRLTLHNNGALALPLQAVEVEMRQRTICFEAAAGTRYTLRYGDPGLEPPVYGYVHRFHPSATPIYAQLGTEQVNPHFIPREEDSYSSRHPELLWLVLLALVVLVGVIALQRVKRQGSY